MDYLLQLLKPNYSPSSIPTISLAQTGSTPNALSSCSNYAPWIINSRASDHMTNLSNLFCTYSPCSGLDKIRIVDSTLSPIVGKSLIKLSKKLNLNSILRVPMLVCNILTISKITKDSNCRVIFCDSYCEFQDQNSRKKIGSAKLIGGLYYFDDDFSGP